MSTTAAAARPSTNGASQMTEAEKKKKAHEFLYGALQYHILDRIKKLVSHNMVDLNLVEKGRLLPISEAIQYNNDAGFDYLLPLVDIKKGCFEGTTPMYIAARWGNPKYVQGLFDRETELNSGKFLEVSPLAAGTYCGRSAIAASIGCISSYSLIENSVWCEEGTNGEVNFDENSENATKLKEELQAYFNKTGNYAKPEKEIHKIEAEVPFRKTRTLHAYYTGNVDVVGMLLHRGAQFTATNAGTTVNALSLVENPLKYWNFFYHLGKGAIDYVGVEGPADSQIVKFKLPLKNFSDDVPVDVIVHYDVSRLRNMLRAKAAEQHTQTAANVHATVHALHGKLADDFNDKFSERDQRLAEVQRKQKEDNDKNAAEHAKQAAISAQHAAAINHNALLHANDRAQSAAFMASTNAFITSATPVVAKGIATENALTTAKALDAHPNIEKFRKMFDVDLGFSIMASGLTTSDKIDRKKNSLGDITAQAIKSITESIPFLSALGVSTIGKVLSVGVQALSNWDAERKNKHIALFFTNTQSEAPALALEMSNKIANECMQFLQLTKVITESDAEKLGKRLAGVAYGVILGTDPRTQKGNLREFMMTAIREDKDYKAYMNKVPVPAAPTATVTTSTAVTTNANAAAYTGSTLTTSGTAPKPVVSPTIKPPIPPKPAIPAKPSIPQLTGLSGTNSGANSGINGAPLITTLYDSSIAATQRSTARSTTSGTGNDSPPSSGSNSPVSTGTPPKPSSLPSATTVRLATAH